jgi:hypothetical protein
MTGSSQKHENIAPEMIFEEEFEEEEISGGYVPVSSSNVITDELSHPEEGEVAQDAIDEEEIVEEHSLSIPPSIPTHESPAKISKQPSEPTEENVDHSTPEVTLKAIAHKSTMLKKQESNYIPSLPDSVTARKPAALPIQENSDDSDSPLDDLSHDRYEQLERLLEDRRQSLTSSDSKVHEGTSTKKREIEEEPKARKKGKWLDMILN